MRTVRALIPAVIIYLIYIFGLTILSHSGFPEDMQSGRLFPYLADKPVGEDGYYMLTVAWNIASGHGIVYNYDMPTTGIQPLSTAIYALLAWIVQFFGGDKWLFARSILVFGSFSLLIFGHIVATIARDLADSAVQDLSYALGFVGVVFNFALFRWFTYGLETGLYLIFFALCVRYSLSLPRMRNSWIREAIVLGVLGGVTIWTRIDFGVVFLIFLAISLLRRQFTLPQVILTGVITTLIISPWFLYNFSVTGSWLPSSGAAQATLITIESAPSRLWTMGKAILSHLTPWIYSNADEIFLFAAFLSFLAFLAFCFREKTIAVFLSSRLNQQPHLTNWFIGSATLILTYVVFFWAGHFYQRYSTPIIIPLTAVMALIVSKRIQMKPKTTQIGLLYILPVCFFVWAFLSLHTGRIGNTHTVTAGFVKDHFSSAKVGAFQSGVIGYFNPNVINLDGKVNQTALDYANENKLHLYVDSEKIDVLVDWPSSFVHTLNSDWLASNWDTCEVQVPNGISICYQRKTLSIK